MIDKLILGLFSLALFVSPFHFFGSSLPQVADYITIIAVALVFINYRVREIFNYSAVRALVYYVFLVFVINLAGFGLNLHSKTNYYFFLSTIYYVYNFLVFISFLAILKRLDKVCIDLFAFIVFATLSFQFLLGLSSSIGIQKPQFRNTLYFNNPNQLGYFAILFFSIFAVLPSRLRSNKLFVLTAFSFASYLILISASRAAYGSTILVAAIIVSKESFKLKVSSMILLSLFGVFAFYVINNNRFVSAQIDRIGKRTETESSPGKTVLKERGYDRFIQYPELAILGAGEGAFDRFTKTYHSGEVHSGLANVLFSYGILGLILFIRFFYFIIKSKPVSNLATFLPILIFNLAHQGMRVTHFWILLCLIYFISEKEIYLNRNSMKHGEIK